MATSTIDIELACPRFPSVGCPSPGLVLRASAAIAVIAGVFFAGYVVGDDIDACKDRIWVFEPNGSLVPACHLLGETSIEAVGDVADCPHECDTLHWNARAERAQRRRLDPSDSVRVVHTAPQCAKPVSCPGGYVPVEKEMTSPVWDDAPTIDDCGNKCKDDRACVGFWYRPCHTNVEGGPFTDRCVLYKSLTTTGTVQAASEQGGKVCRRVKNYCPNIPYITEVTKLNPKYDGLCPWPYSVTGEGFYDSGSAYKYAGDPPDDVAYDYNWPEPSYQTVGNGRGTLRYPCTQVDRYGAEYTLEMQCPNNATQMSNDYEKEDCGEQCAIRSNTHTMVDKECERLPTWSIEDLVRLGYNDIYNKLDPDILKVGYLEPGESCSTPQNEFNKEHNYWAYTQVPTSGNLSWYRARADSYPDDSYRPVVCKGGRMKLGYWLKTTKTTQYESYENLQSITTFEFDYYYGMKCDAL